ncbi:hypothetical protein RJ55_03923 [Drechmeria coniospora]|nr:hypothetical protein RJ55_03923 [Drechmeria coniospora]
MTLFASAVTFASSSSDGAINIELATVLPDQNSNPGAPEETSATCFRREPRPWLWLACESRTIFIRSISLAKRKFSCSGNRPCCQGVVLLLETVS